MALNILWARCRCYIWPVVDEPGLKVGEPEKSLRRCGYCNSGMIAFVNEPEEGKARPLRKDELDDFDDGTL